MALGDITLINNKEYIDLTPKMTGNNTPSPYIVSATDVNSFSQYKAFDGDDMTYYRSGILFTTGSIQMYFGKDVVCNCYTLSAGNTAWTMRDWVFQGSKDGSKWDTLHTIDGMTDWIGAETVHTFEFENDIPYSYYRIYCSKKNGNNSICIGEWKFYERRGTTMTFHKVLEVNLPSEVTTGNDEIYFTNEGNIYISKKDGTLMKIGGSGSGGSGGSLKRIKLDVLTDRQIEFETNIVPKTSIDKMAFYLVVNSNIYIDEISTALNQNGKIVMTFDNTKFDLETTDVIYLLYSDESDATFATDSDIDDMFN